MRLEELEPVTMFAVPPLDPRVRLYLDRSAGRPINLQGYGDREGAQYASPVAYFGSLLFFCPGDEEAFGAVAGVLGGGDAGDDDGGDDCKAGDGPVLRADFAYDAALLRELARDYCAWAYGEGSPLARAHETRLFGQCGAEATAVAADPADAR